MRTIQAIFVALMAVPLATFIYGATIYNNVYYEFPFHNPVSNIFTERALTLALATGSTILVGRTFLPAHGPTKYVGLLVLLGVFWFVDFWFSFAMLMFWAESWL